MSGPEKPNLDILRPRSMNVTVRATIEEKCAAVDRYNDEYRTANWWQWNVQQWEEYLIQNAQERQLAGENYQPHEHERMFVEYGKWLIKNPSSEEDKKLDIIMNLTTIHVFYWKRGEEPPLEILKAFSLD